MSTIVYQSASYVQQRLKTDTHYLYTQGLAHGKCVSALRVV